MAADKGKDDPIDVELVRKLAELLNETGLREIEVERGDLRVKVVRGPSAAETAMASVIHAAPPVAAAGPQALAASAAAPEPPGDAVKSPMVGTVYLQPNPGAEQFVRVGSQVAAGQTLMIIEAMKTMNPVPAPRAGRVVEILIDDGQPVEFGQPLIVLE